MIPFTFNVETYLKTNGTPPGSRDLFVPESSHRKGHKLQSAMKFLGGLAGRKGGVFLVGGILAVGCTVRFLRKKRNGQRASLHGEGELSSSHNDMATQTDPCLAPSLANASATLPLEDEADIVPSIEYARMFHEAPKSISSVTDPLDENIRSEFNRAP